MIATQPNKRICYNRHMLSLQLLGIPQVLRNAQPLTLSRRKSRALLYYLAAHTTARAREQLLTLLWPDLDRAAAQQTLRSSVYGLRKELGDALLITDSMLALAPEVHVDLRLFEAYFQNHSAKNPDKLFASSSGTPGALQAHSEISLLESTLQQYRGDFLANFSLPDCEDYQRWVEMQRERLRLLALHGYIQLAQRYETIRDFVAAQAALAQALAINPLQEEVHRAAMRIDYFAGDRAAAIRRYEQLRHMLDEELGVPPLEETRSLYDAIITDALLREHDKSDAIRVLPQPKQPIAQLGAGTLPFVGREKELAELQQLALTNRLALIEGEAGIGKTSLAEAFLHDFSGTVLIGRAHELEQALPYHPVIEALRHFLQHGRVLFNAQLKLANVWRSELARLMPEFQAEIEPAIIDTTLVGGNEARLWEAINQLLHVLAEQQALAFLIDDLHWADASTLALLGYLLRQSAHAKITFLATTRIIEPRSQLATLVQTLTRQNRLQRLQLARLDQSATLTLAQHFSPQYAYPLAEWLDSNAEGNPYVLTELLRYANEHGIVLPDGIINLNALSNTPVVPSSVYSLIQARLHALSELAQRVLDVAVAIGSEFDLEVIRQASGLSELKILDALDELGASRLILPLEGLRYGFDHPLTMEVAYREVSEARHRLIHRGVAEALERVYANQLDEYAGLIASHFAEGNAGERAAHYAFLAGRRAAELSAWTEAIAFYQQALAGADNSQRLNIYVALGSAYMYAGAPAQATDELRIALTLAEQQREPETADTIRLMLMRTMISQARIAEAIMLAEQVLERAAPHHRISAELMWATALSIEGVDLAGAALHLQRAMSQPNAVPSAEQQAQIQFELGGIAAQQGDLSQALEHYHAALLIAETGPTIVQYRILALNNLAYHHMLQGNSLALDYAMRGLELAQEYGLIGLQVYLYSTLGEIALAEHNLDEAERQWNTGLALAERLNIRERVAGITANLGLLAIQRGQPARAIHRLAGAQAQADTLRLNHLSALIRIWLAPLLPPDEARIALSEARAIAESGGRSRLLQQIAQLEASL